MWRLTSLRTNVNVHFHFSLFTSDVNVDSNDSKKLGHFISRQSQDLWPGETNETFENWRQKVQNDLKQQKRLRRISLTLSWPTLKGKLLRVTTYNMIMKLVIGNTFFNGKLKLTIKDCVCVCACVCICPVIPNGDKSQSHRKGLFSYFHQDYSYRTQLQILMPWQKLLTFVCVMITVCLSWPTCLDTFEIHKQRQYFN